MQQPDRQARRAVVNAAYRLGGSIVERLLRGVLLIPLVVRRFGVASYGQYAMALSIVNMVRPLVVGAAPLLTAEAARRPRSSRRLIARASNEALLVGLALAVAVTLIGDRVAPELASILPWMALVLACDAVVLRGLQLSARMRDAPVVLAGVLGALGLVAAAGLLAARMRTLAMCTTVAGMVQAAAVLVMVRRDRARPITSAAPQPERSLYLRAWPALLLALVNGVGGNLDVVLVAWLAGAFDAGCYAAAARLLAVTIVVPSAIASSLLPMYAAPSELARRRCVDGMAVAFALGLPLALFAPFYAPTLHALLGAKLVIGAGLLAALGTRMALAFVGVVAVGHLIAGGRQRGALIVEIGSLALLVALTPFAIARAGVLGAAVAAATAEAFKTIGFVALLGGASVVRLGRRVALPASGCAVAWLVGRHVATSSWMRLAVAGVVYLIFLERSWPGMGPLRAHRLSSWRRKWRPAPRCDGPA
jgi:O-antigen/teichoic acid export membrane protein